MFNDNMKIGICNQDVYCSSLIWNEKNICFALFFNVEVIDCS